MLDSLRQLRAVPISTEVVGSVAAFLFVRWAKHQDDERAAIAEFDGGDYDRAFLRAFLLKSNADRPRTSLANLAMGVDDKKHGNWLAHVSALTDALSEKLKPRDTDSFAINVSRALKLLENPALQLPEYMEWLGHWFGHFDLAIPEHRLFSERMLDELVEASVSRESGAGQFYTPRRIVELMVELASPELGDRIYDPCFGMGGNLVQCARRLRTSAKVQGSREWTVFNGQSIFGLERNETAYVVGLTRIVLAGISEPGLELGNALERTNSKGGEQFDVVLANPPWGGKAQEAAHTQYRIQYASLENFFLQHAMAALRPGGRAVVALPEGALFKPGADMKVREQLLAEFDVQGVISLPAGAFQPATAVKSSLVVFRKTGPTSKVRFVTVPLLPQRGSRTPSDWLDVAGTVALFREDGRSENAWTTSVASLRKRDAELIAKRPLDEELEDRLQTIRRSDEQIERRELGEIADVFTGISYDKQTAVPATSSDNRNGSIPLLRVSDIRDSRVLQPELVALEPARIPERAILRPNDVLLTATGSIGRAAVYRPKAEQGAVAAKSIIVIRPREMVSAAYLMALLDSSTYQQWLTGTARGATIQNLSVRAVRHLPVPVPPLPQQEQVATQWSKEGGDVLDLLSRSVPRGRSSRAAMLRHAMAPARRIRNEIVHGAAGGVIAQLEKMAHVISSFRFEDEEPTSDDFAWFNEWTNFIKLALAPLRGISEIVSGPSRYAVLQAARSDLRMALSALGHARDETLDSDELQLIRSCHDISELAQSFIESESKRLLERVDVRATVDPAEIASGSTELVQLRISNESSLPLRNFSAQVKPPVGSLRKPFFADASVASASLKLAPEDVATPKQLDLKLTWSAERLDGTNVSGENAFAIQVTDGARPGLASELGTSPYIVGKPVDPRREDVFFGREDVINKIVRQMGSKDHSNVVLLEGNRRTGKTSILKQLEQHGRLKEWVIANCSLQGGEGEKKEALATGEVFRLIAEQIGLAAHKAGLNVWIPNAPERAPGKPWVHEFFRVLPLVFSGDQPFKTLELFILEILKAAAPRRLLLLLDEFDILQVGIDAGMTSPMVPQNLRYLLHTYPDFSLVITGSHRLRRLREEYWSALFGLGYSIQIGAIALEAARLLVTRPVEGRLIYAHEATDRVVELAARQPFLIQSLCNRIFDLAAETGERVITVAIVNMAATEMASNNEHFATLWDYAATERRRLVMWLVAKHTGGTDPVTYRFLETQLDALGVEIPRSERLTDDLDTLRELELIEIGAGDTYHIVVPLFEEWIKRNRPYDVQVAKAVDEGRRKR
jgi:type I restriction enzyme M protein